MSEKQKTIGLLAAVLALAALLTVPALAKKNLGKNLSESLSDCKNILQKRQGESKQKKNALSFDQVKELVGKRAEEKTKKRADKKEIEKIQAMRTKE